MTTYDPPTDIELASGQPITTGKNKRLRDMSIAIIEGAPGAPRATSRIITPGGAACDGILLSSTTLTGPGYFDFSSLAVTTGITLPILTWMRADGNSSMVGTVRVPGIGTNIVADDIAVAFAYGALYGNSAPTHATDAGGGGGAVGDGSPSQAGGAAGVGGGMLAGLFRYLCLRRAMMGGAGGGVGGTPGQAGGGFLGLFVHGNLNLTGCTIDASGVDSYNGSSFVVGAGGGGGIIIACTGTLTGGTFNAKGGNGYNSGAQVGGNGGGGYVSLMAAAYAGSQTINVAKGTGGNGTAQDGTSDTYTLTESQINSMLLR